jgi:hypothetical protein
MAPSRADHVWTCMQDCVYLVAWCDRVKAVYWSVELQQNTNIKSELEQQNFDTGNQVEVDVPLFSSQVFYLKK